MGSHSDTNKYNIISGRVEIFRDFTINLVHCIYDYYLDKQTLSLDEDIYNHFVFCYNKVCAEFLEEEIDFRDNEMLIEYFSTYYYHHFYRNENDVPKSQFLKFWDSIFNIDKPKNKNTLKALIELYANFDHSITSPKNILELV